MKTIYSILLSLTLLLSVKIVPAENVTRVILFMIDGMHWEAPGKLNMPVLNSLIGEGVYIQKSYMIIPHHPTIGDYSNFNSCSFPNPMLHEGTVFIRPGNRMIQEMISPERQTAFIVNTSDYYTVANGFTTCIMDPSMDDKQVVEQAVTLLENQDIAFMRIHLQTAGNLGLSVFMSNPDEPYHRNIWGENSPYAGAVENADKLLGEFITYLKESGEWENSILIVTSDHGQSRIGWHPLFDEDSWTTPLVFYGQGIAKGRELPYFEHTSLAPTIAWLPGVEPPN
ncbi:MAG: sulfatase-like hydrolase/transferase, partial [Prolixibacteraceae bacterium]|nr:sulfatase-like hydrolase/transferase [Prolixibacteraceae bacterium]